MNVYCVLRFNLTFQTTSAEGGFHHYRPLDDGIIQECKHFLHFPLAGSPLKF